MKEKKIENYIVKVFGFDVPIKNVILKYDEEAKDYYPDNIDYETLGEKVFLDLLAKQEQWTGAEFKFMRQQVKKSLREMAEIVGVSHSCIKEWEENTNKKTKMTKRVEAHTRRRLLRLFEVIQADRIDDEINNFEELVA